MGAAEAEITPKTPQYLAGYSLARVAEGVHSPLKARACVFELGGERVAIVGIDSLGMHREDADWIKSGIPGFANGNVFLCSSHTHAAPDLIGFWGWYLLSSGRDRAYLQQVRAGVAKAVAAALAAAKPARLSHGSAELPPQGLVRNTNRPEVFDRRFHVVQAHDAQSGAPLAAILHLACHPEVLRRGNTKVSADFVHDLCERWQQAGLGQPVFVNGALGAMVTPAVRPNGEEGIPIMGQRLFTLAQAAARAAVPLGVRELEVRRRDVFVELTSPPLLLGRLSLAILRPAYGGEMRSTVGYLRLGPLEIATVPGEIEPGFAADLRARAHRPEMLVFGLVDDELGYLMRVADARDPEFAYERLMSPCVDAGERVFSALVTTSPSRVR